MKQSNRGHPDRTARFRDTRRIRRRTHLRRTPSPRIGARSPQKRSSPTTRISRPRGKSRRNRHSRLHRIPSPRSQPRSRSRRTDHSNCTSHLPGTLHRNLHNRFPRTLALSTAECTPPLCISSSDCIPPQPDIHRKGRRNHHCRIPSPRTKECMAATGPHPTDRRQHLHRRSRPARRRLRARASPAVPQGDPFF